MGIAYTTVAIDKIVVLLVFLTGCLICAVSVQHHLQQEYIGVTLIGASLVYQAFRSRLLRSGFPSEICRSKSRMFVACGIVFALLFTLSLLVLRLEAYHRPAAFFLLVSGMAALVALQIMGARTGLGTLLILLEIFGLSALIRSSLYYLFPALHGVDPLYHFGLVTEILQNGSFPAAGYEAYADFPLTHYLLAVLESVALMGLKNAFFVLGVLMIVSTLFVFLITRDLFHVKAGLLAVLLLNMSSWHILWSVDITPMSLGTILFLVLLFLVFSRTLSSGGQFSLVSILIFFIAAVVVCVHVIPTIVLFVASVSILAGALAQRFSIRNLRIGAAQIHLNSKYAAYFGLITILYWQHAYGTETRSFYEKVVFSVYDSLQGAAIGNVGAVTQIAKFDLLQIVLDNLGYALLVALMLLGLFSVLAHENSRGTGVTLLVLTGALFAFIYIPALVGSNASLPHRWFLYAYVPASILAAIGCWSMLAILKRPGAKIAAITAIALCFTFFMTTNSLVNSDSPLYPNVREDSITWAREYYYDSEVYAGRFLAKRSCNDNIVTDGRFTNVFTEYYGYEWVYPMYPSDPGSYAKGVVLLRENVRNGRIVDRPTGYVYTYEKAPKAFLDGFEGARYTRAYSSSNVTTYVPCPSYEVH
ncbi:hypothetical protein FGU65_02180 [Methanoculleus sp. FWC-SCC1]|uniref:Glycosyltransferase RgtA/B/C/D-like domain-containing protein n=1 Tax=Methanoculleus frigidifontis TaxID=2584085 RepID=A0ABT8M706_9EURY|nr:hypothetical protein [Methanoculleus sp. FWC-SCC1]MDN7023714.1 hypothetical protein [Methanoculleus sp. FWC-SCC1]